MGSGRPAPAENRRRNAGRTATRSRIDTAANTIPSTQTGPPNRALAPAADRAPPLSISRNRSPVSASAPANASAATSQISAPIVTAYVKLTCQAANYYTACIMWCPSVSLSVWANAWLAGVAAPDDVLDALSLWAPRHSVTAYDSVAADRTGLPWPDLTDAGAVSMLQTLRTAAGPITGEPAMAVALPVPGDVRGLPAGTQFTADAITAGEALIVDGGGRGAVGLVPEFTYDESDPDYDH